MGLSGKHNLNRSIVNQKVLDVKVSTINCNVTGICIIAINIIVGNQIVSDLHGGQVALTFAFFGIRVSPWGHDLFSLSNFGEYLFLLLIKQKTCLVMLFVLKHTSFCNENFSPVSLLHVSVSQFFVGSLLSQQKTIPGNSTLTLLQSFLGTRTMH